MAVKISEDEIRKIAITLASKLEFEYRLDASDALVVVRKIEMMILDAMERNESGE